MSFKQENTHLPGHGSSYPLSSRLSGYVHKSQTLGKESDLIDLEASPSKASEVSIMSPNMGSMKNMASESYGFSPQSHSSQTPVPRFAAHRKQSRIISPSARHVAHSQLEKLLEIETQEQCDALIQIPEKPLHNEMPIGSLVHFQSPHEWGVVKIANIPYSITKQEIVQFLGRQARLIRNDHGCPIHIIMERSTAKTMDCYAELETVQDARDTVVRINKIFETGRAPRLGNRVVDLELSSQDELLKDLFPRAKCLIWKNGIPIALENSDFYSTGFAGFLTSEEIYGAIRHAEIPHRSPFCAKCPQRTYESTISTLHKFPWYATRLYTVHDRNSLFNLANRHIKSLAYRLKATKTIGIDWRLLHDLLHAGLNCPAFNERQKFTLCVNSGDVSEIVKFPDMAKWFPFDTLVKMPQFDEDTLLYYAKLISKGHLDDDHENCDLPNKFPGLDFDLESPYGHIWFEWPTKIAKRLTWEDAVHREMMNLCNLVMSGCINNEQETTTLKFGHLSLGSTATTATTATSSSQVKYSSNTAASPLSTENTQISEGSPSKVAIYATPSRQVKHKHGASYAGFFAKNLDDDPWGHRSTMRPLADRAKPGYLGHRNTLSSPCFLSKGGR